MTGSIPLILLIQSPAIAVYERSLPLWADDRDAELSAFEFAVVENRPKKREVRLMAGMAPQPTSPHHGVG